MEYLDIYDENAHKTGKIILRGTPIAQGEYSMAVHLYIYDRNGMFLIQKRSKNKKSLPGIWSVTCGAVSSGENSVQAGIREAREEVGLPLEEDQLRHVARIKRRRSFIDVYFVQIDFSLDDCVLQEEEVDEVRLCTPGELLRIISSSERTKSSYYSAVEKELYDRRLIARRSDPASVKNG